MLWSSDRRIVVKWEDIFLFKDWPQVRLTALKVRPKREYNSQVGLEGLRLLGLVKGGACNRVLWNDQLLATKK